MQLALYILDYSLNKTNLTTTLKQGACNFGYSEVDVWKKKSSKPVVRKSISDEIEYDYEISEAIVGGIAASIE